MTTMSPTTLVRALKKWWWVLVALTVGGAAVGGVTTLLMTPQYSASSQIFVAFDAPAGAGSAELVQANNFAIQKVYSYVEVATSPRVLDTVIEELGLDETADDLATQISVTVPPNSAVMRITALAPNPDDAAVLASTLVDAFSETVLELETPTGGGTPPLRIESLAEAVPSDTPASPSLLINIAIGAFAGFAIGVIWIAIAAVSDRKVYNGADITADGTDLRVLGSVPLSSGSDSLTIVTERPLSEVSEAYRTIAATLGHTAGVGLGVVAVAAATPRDTSSALTSNLALSFQEFGANVAVIDANLRSGEITSSLGLSGPGLAECLAGTATATEVVQSVNGIDILPSGTTTDSPAELISGVRFEQVVKALSSVYDLVLIDSAPVLPLSDTLFSASHANSTVLAVSSGTVTAAQLKAARSSLESVSANVVGVVVLDTARSGADADVATATYRDLRSSTRA